MSTKENKKIEIIKGAMRVFCKNGFHSAKMEDIAKEAGVGKGTIYEYFDSKKSLFQEMIKYNIEQYKNKLKEVLLKENEIKDKLIAFGKFHSKFVVSHFDVVQMLILQSQILPVDMKQLLLEGNNEIFSVISEVIVEGIEKGEFRKDLDVEIATSSVIGTVNQYYRKKIFMDKVSHEEVDIVKAIDTLYSGLK